MMHLQCRSLERGFISRSEQEDEEEAVVKHLKTLVVALGVTTGLSMTAQSEEKPVQSEEKTAAPGKCLEATVNPVTGFAFCINPRGAPVDPPPVSALKPCKPRAHDSDPMTVYERWSGCGD